MKKTAIRNFLVCCFAPLASFLYFEKPRVRVLALHDISITEKDFFIKKMKWLKQYVNIVSLQSAYERKNLNNSRLNVVLTFDDGFGSFFSLVAPILKDLFLPATFFVPSGVIGMDGEKADLFALHNLGRHGKFDFISEEKLRILSENLLFEIGGHTLNHTDLGRQLSEEMLLQEVKKDKIAIEKIIGKQINFLAYPFGGIKNVCNNSARYISEVGYKASFTIIPSFWRRRDDLFYIGRDSLSLQDSNRVWKAWLSGGYDVVSRLKNFWLRFGISR